MASNRVPIPLCLFTFLAFGLHGTFGERSTGSVITYGPGVDSGSRNELGEHGIIFSSFMTSIVGDVNEKDFILAAIREETTGPSGENISETCLQDVKLYLTDLLSFKPYALQMRSSYAALPSLVSLSFSGRLKYDGSYELCTSTRKGEKDAPFNGKYCQMFVPLAENKPAVSFSVCTPSSCNPGELGILVSSVLDTFDIEGSVYFTCMEDEPWTAGAIFVLGLLSFFGACVLIGTLYDVIDRRRNIISKETYIEKDENQVLNEANPQENGNSLERKNVEVNCNVVYGDKEDSNCRINGKFRISDERTTENSSKNKEWKEILSDVLRSFSCIFNGAKILKCDDSSNQLSALNGIRVLTMIWIIFGHTVLFIFFVGFDNPLYILETMKYALWYRVAFKALFAVDTFFMLSGLLVTLLTLKHLQKNKGRINWFFFYLHRYLRLTPTYMVCLGIYASLILLHVGNGPYKKPFWTASQKTCSEKWWANLLYINNLVPPLGKSIESCMGWTWYLATDMQFFVASPLILSLLYRPRLRKFGLGAMAGLTLASCLVTTLLSAFYGYPLGTLIEAFTVEDNSTNVDYSLDYVYNKPWSRVPCYVIGMFVGYILFRMKKTTYKIPMVWNLLGWTISLSIIFIMTCILYASADDGSNQNNWITALWGFDRILFTSSVAWVAFACVTGNGGPINTFLSWNFWQPLSRLTFCAYLLHPMVIFLFLLNKKVLFHGDVNELIYVFISNVVLSYFFAFLLSLLVEGPSLGITKILLKRKKH